MEDKYTSVCVIGCTFNCLSLWGTAAHLLCYLNVLLGYHLGEINFYVPSFFFQSRLPPKHTEITSNNNGSKRY